MAKLQGAAKQRKIFSQGRKPWEYKDQDRQLSPVPGLNTL
jgi:hypothetical protein